MGNLLSVLLVDATCADSIAHNSEGVDGIAVVLDVLRGGCNDVAVIEALCTVVRELCEHGTECAHCKQWYFSALFCSLLTGGRLFYFHDVGFCCTITDSNHRLTRLHLCNVVCGTICPSSCLA